MKRPPEVLEEGAGIVRVVVEGDVFVEDALVLDDLDIFSEVGGYVPLVKLISNVNVADGALNIRFEHTGSENPKINGIEVLGL